MINRKRLYLNYYNFQISNSIKIHHYYFSHLSTMLSLRQLEVELQIGRVTERSWQAHQPRTPGLGKSQHGKVLPSTGQQILF